MTAPCSQMTHDEIIQWCRQHIATLLDFPNERIPVDAEFDTFGLDSAAAVSLVVELEELMGFEVSPSLLFDFPTIQMMAAEIVRLRAAAAAKVLA